MPWVDCSRKLGLKTYSVRILRVGDKMVYQQFWLRNHRNYGGINKKILKVSMRSLQELRAIPDLCGSGRWWLGKRRVRSFTEMTDWQKDFWLLLLPFAHKSWDTFCFFS